MTNTTSDSDAPTAAAHKGAQTRTSFGYRNVAAEERQGLVNDVFSRVAGRYDLMNDLMSGGLHRLWKQDLITALNPPKSDAPYVLLDVASGTGDIALRFARQAGSRASAVICDINEDMLAVAKDRIATEGLDSKITTVAGNAEALPLADAAFDGYTVAFGIRNVTDIDAALKDAYRVLKIGGRFLCLEFSHVEMPLLDRLYDFHSFEVIPRIGAWVAGSEDSYRYLVESIRKFPDQNAFARRIEEAGFEQVSFRNLTGGIAAIHSGWKL